MKAKTTQKFTKKQASLGIVLFTDWVPVPLGPIDPNFPEVPSERFLADVPPGGGTWQLAILRANTPPFLVGAFKAPSQVGAQRPIGSLVHYALYQIA